MPEVEVGLGAVIGDEYLAVLIRRHRARVNVEIGVELDDGDAQAARFEEEADRGGGDSLTEGGGEQLKRIHEISNTGDAEGASRWSPECKLPSKGFWYPPTIFTGVSQSHRIARDEIFGPVLSVLTFRTPAEGIEKANNTMYGLSAGVWSDKGSKILWAAKQLKAGVVWSNTFNKFDPASPFGGYKESGWGREGGRHGLAGYLTSQVKESK